MCHYCLKYFSMKKEVFQSIFQSAKNDKRIILLSADLGYGALEEFAAALPKQCINVWISEQHMVSMAAWLALSAYKVFCYSIAPFMALRCLEQTRVDLGYQNLNVTLIGSGAGFSYGSLWTTHYGLEEIGAMMLIPNMKLYLPCDPQHASMSIASALQDAQPSYIRIDRGGESSLLSETEIYDFSTIWNMQQADIIVCHGSISSEAMKAQAALSRQGREIDIVVLHSYNNALGFHPQMLSMLNSHERVYFLEEHILQSWLWVALWNALLQSWYKGRYQQLWNLNSYPHVVGSQEYMRGKYGLDARSIIQHIWATQ